MLDYNAVKSLTEDELLAGAPDLQKLRDSDNPDNRDIVGLYAKATPEEVKQIERFLDVQPGTLVGQDYYLQKANCGLCDEPLTFVDFVLTSLVDAEHPKSFVLHTFVGLKFVVNAPRAVRCFKCGNHDPSLTLGYGCDRYGCPRPPG